jgi:hypothetical protein
MCILIKSYTPMTLKNDYMSYKYYNFMKTLLKCEILMNFHDNEFCAILICFIGDKVYSKEWTI